MLLMSADVDDVELFFSGVVFGDVVVDCCVCAIIDGIVIPYDCLACVARVSGLSGPCVYWRHVQHASPTDHRCRGALGSYVVENGMLTYICIVARATLIDMCFERDSVV